MEEKPKNNCPNFQSNHFVPPLFGYIQQTKFKTGGDPGTGDQSWKTI